jgi:hypothetical protein
MKAKGNQHSRSHRPAVLAAVVLGTALTALGPTAAHAQAPTETLRVISDISRYCTVCWRNAHLAPDHWSDCTQEVFARLLERVSVDDWSRVLAVEGDERRQLVRAIDTVKKRCQRSRKWIDGRTDSLADRNDQHRRWLADERELVRQAADQLLSSRQQSILQGDPQAAAASGGGGNYANQELIPMSVVDPFSRVMETMWHSFDIDVPPSKFIKTWQRCRAEERNLYAISLCEAEVCNGGFHQFFSNQSVILAPETVEGYKTVGLKPYADLVKETMAFFGDPYPRAFKVRGKLYMGSNQRP